MRLDAKNVTAYCARTTVHSNKRDYDKAIEDFTAAIRLSEKDPAIYYHHGLAYEGKGEHGKAIADYSDAVRLDAKSVDAYLGRAAAKWAKGDRDGIMADYNSAVVADPKSADAYSGRLGPTRKRATWKRRLPTTRRQFGSTPKRSETYVDRATASLRGKAKLTERSPTVTRPSGWARKIRPYRCRGSAYDSKKDWDKAIADYTSAIRLDPKDAQTYYNRGIAYDGRHDSTSQSAITARPPSSIQSGRPAHQPRLCPGRKGRARQGDCRLYLAIRLDAKDPLTFLDRGLAYESKREHDKAIADYSAAIRLDPKYTDAYATAPLPSGTNINDGGSMAKLQHGKCGGPQERTLTPVAAGTTGKQAPGTRRLPIILRPSGSTQNAVLRTMTALRH